MTPIDPEIGSVHPDFVSSSASGRFSVETSNRSCTSCTETVSKFFRFKPLELWLSEEQIPQVIVFIMNPQNEESVYRAAAQGRQWAARFRLVNSE